MNTKQKVSIKVVSYDEQADTFDCEISNDALTGSSYETHEIDAAVLPLFAGMYGEPDEFVGQTFELLVEHITI